MVSLNDFTFAFEMATTSTPRTSSPSYTDLTSFVMAADTINLTRGRGSEQDRSPQPGRANVTLRNTDGRFTMGNGSSPYAPLQLRRPCRFRVTYSATTYNLWQGFVDTWENGRNETTGRAQLEMSDRVARSAQFSFGDAYDAEVLADAPTAYYPLSEPGTDISGANIVDSAAPRLVAYGTNGAVTTFGVGAVGPDDATAVALTTGTAASDYAYVIDTVGNPALPLSGASGVTTEMVVRPMTAMRASATSANWAGGVIQVNPNLTVVGYDNGGLATATSTVRLTIGQWYHLAMTQTASGGTVTVTIYINGVSAGTASYAAASITDSATGSSIGGGECQVAKFAMHKQALSPSRLLERAGALTYWAAETTSQRAARLCRLAGVPSAFYSTGSSGFQMGRQPLKGKTLLAALTEVAEADNGVVYVTSVGALTFAPAASRYNKTAGLTLDASKSGQFLSDSAPRADTDALVNDATATLYGGSDYRAFAQTSIDAYDQQTATSTIYGQADYNALNWAQWQVASYKDPRPRLESVTVDVVAYANSGGNVANLLNADVGTKVQVTNLPSDTSATSTLTLFIEGVRHSISKNQWLITFTTSPVALEDSVWVLDSNSLDTTTTLGY